MNDVMDPDEESAPAHHVRKTRKCLRCTESFASEWFGERICPRCKRSTGWKLGIPASTPRFSGPD